ncbi:MAG: ATP-binding cassette domain-containing protein [Desulfurococcales archaeon]|jgi:ABC-type phosphate/phosphonate transport system ATPase subunit|nr:ATP-binding cassette domain-containing protein [Desulfurococcales archaeon]
MEAERTLKTWKAIVLRDVEFSYGRLKILKGVSLEVDAGSAIAIMGRSGSGKTTILKIIAGLLKPERGFVRVLGLDIYRDGFKDIRGRIAYIPQSIGLIEGASALYNVLIARAPEHMFRFITGFWSWGDVRDAMEALSIVGLDGKAGVRVDRLSGGEKQRVAIARALFQRADIVLADEPVSNLDRDTAENIVKILAGLSRKGVTVISVLHDLDLALSYFNRVYILNDGRLREIV